LQVVNLLVEHFYGPGDNGSKFIPSLMDKCLMNSTTIDLTSGDQKRDFIYIDDLVKACNIVIENCLRLAALKKFQLGVGKCCQLRTLFF